VTEQRALLRMPRTLARSLGKGRHDLVATEPVAGFIAVAEIPKR
jgi:hypothetical protein